MIFKNQVFVFLYSVEVTQFGPILNEDDSRAYLGVGAFFCHLLLTLTTNTVPSLASNCLVGFAQNA